MIAYKAIFFILNLEKGYYKRHELAETSDRLYYPITTLPQQLLTNQSIRILLHVWAMLAFLAATFQYILSERPVKII